MNYKLKKVLFVIEQLSTGGAERVTAALVNNLCAQYKYEVHLVVLNKKNEKEYCLEENVIRHDLDVCSSSIKSIVALRKLILKVNPSCVVSLGMTHTATKIVLAMHGIKIPIILSERNEPSRYSFLSKQWLMRQYCFSFCDGVVFQTESAKKYFTKNIQKKGIVIANPITDNLPEKYDGKREKILVNFCKLSKQKNLDLLLDAFKDISCIFPEYILKIYGDGPEKEHLQQKIIKNGMEQKIFLCGHSSNIHDEILKAAAFVSSSDYEGISNSMLEALALGIPTICTDCPAGGARETIENGYNGLLVPVRDKKRLVEAIKMVLEDECLAKKISYEGYKIRKQMDAKTISKQWDNFIEKMCKKENKWV